MKANHTEIQNTQPWETRNHGNERTKTESWKHGDTETWEHAHTEDGTAETNHGK